MADTTLTAELDLLARDLEELTGTTPLQELVRDKNLPARIRRIRGVLGLILTNLVLVSGGGTVLRSVSFVVQDPENIKTHAARGTKSFTAYLNDSGFTFRITKIFAISDTDNYTFRLTKSASDSDVSTTNETQIASISCATDGNSGYYANVLAFDSDALETGKWLIFAHSAGSAETLSVIVEGYYDV